MIQCSYKLKKEKIVKKLIALLALTVASTSAFADGHWGHGGGHGYHGGYGHYENHYHNSGVNWVAPALIGGIIGYELSQPRTVYVQPQPQVYYSTPAYQQQPRTVYQNCTAWIETIDQYGNTTRTRTCY
jgi:hypothetical protein